MYEILRFTNGLLSSHVSLRAVSNVSPGLQSQQHILDPGWSTSCRGAILSSTKVCTGSHPEHSLQETPLHLLCTELARYCFWPNMLPHFVLTSYSCWLQQIALNSCYRTWMGIDKFMLFILKLRKRNIRTTQFDKIQRTAKCKNVIWSHR
jgi:hypothetical protein